MEGLAPGGCKNRQKKFVQVNLHPWDEGSE